MSGSQMWLQLGAHLSGRGHFVDGVAAVGGVDGARSHAAMLRQVIHCHHSSILLQHVHYRRPYPPFVEPCISGTQEAINSRMRIGSGCTLAWQFAEYM